MDRLFTVHSQHPTQVPVAAKLGSGQPVIANVDGIIVELVPADDSTRSITLDLIPASNEERQQMLADFAQGNQIKVTFAKV